MGVFQLVVLLQGGRGRSGAVSLAGLFSAPAARKGTPADEDVSHMLAQVRPEGTLRTMRVTACVLSLSAAL